jgi:glucose-1-phosphate cytidylyltransferase
VFRHEIFDYMHEGEELVERPFRRLIERRRLSTVKYDGFWSCMDTFKEKQNLDEMYARGNAPWELWRQSSADEPSRDNSPQPVLPAGDLNPAPITQPV